MSQRILLKRASLIVELKYLHNENKTKQIQSGKSRDKIGSKEMQRRGKQ